MTSITNEEIAELMQEAGGAVSALLLRDEGEFAETIAKLVLALESLSREREWLPIETAPKDGAFILVANRQGAWIAKHQEFFQSGFKPENPWQSMMLNHRHISESPRDSVPTHWRPLPPPPKIKEAKDLTGKDSEG